MGQYESADRLFQVAWLQIWPVWRRTEALAHVLGPTGGGLRDVLTGHEARRYRSLRCVAVYLHDWRVAIVVDWKLGLGSGHCVSKPVWLVLSQTKLNAISGSVMGLCPILLNMMQFWLIDSIVKASDSLGLNNALSPPVDESQEPLFMNEPDSEDEDEPVRERRRRASVASVDLEGGYTSPTKHATTHSRALSPSSIHGKLDKESAAPELDEPGRNAPGKGKSRTSIEFQQPVVRRRSPPPSPHYGATGESPTAWGGFEDDAGWGGEEDPDPDPWGGAGKQRSPKLGTRRRKSSGGSGSWKLDTINPPSRDRDQAPRSP